MKEWRPDGRASGAVGRPRHSDRDEQLRDVIRSYARAMPSASKLADITKHGEREADTILNLVDVSPPARMLDLACGMGAAAVNLAKRGFEVTGLDCTLSALQVGRRISEEEGVRVSWLCADMRRLHFHSIFDCVMLRDVILGIYDSYTNLDLIKRMVDALKPGGTMLLEVWNKEFAMDHRLQNVLEYEPECDAFIDPTGKTDLTIHLHTEVEWSALFAEHGLEVIKRDGWNWPNDPPSPPWRADYYVAQKMP